MADASHGQSGLATVGAIALVVIWALYTVYVLYEGFVLAGH